MRVSFSFLRQLLELLTSDWQDYLNNEIKKLKILSITKTNDGLVKLLVSDSYCVNLETRIEIIKSKINADSEFSRLFNTNNWINFATSMSKFDVYPNYTSKDDFFNIGNSTISENYFDQE